MSCWNFFPLNQSCHQNRWDGKTRWRCSMWTFGISLGRKMRCPMHWATNTNLMWNMWGKHNFKKRFDYRAAMMSLPRKWSKTFKRELSHTSICEMDYYDISKIGSMFRKGGLRMCSWRSAMLGCLRAMVVQSAPQHSSRSPTIGLIWKTMQRNTWRLAWFANKI
jgi:hypothetical protein